MTLAIAGVNISPVSIQPKSFHTNIEGNNQLGKIISVCNQKGGTGKTTTVISLGSYLALAGKKVLILDSDPQGNATSGIGIDKSNIENNAYNVILGSTHALDAVIPTQLENLYLIPSNIDLTGAEVELVGMMAREYRLKKALEPAKESFDFILIDCPPSLGLLTINALTACDSVLIPIQCEYFALEGLSQLTNTINLVRENLNKTLELEGVLLTMADYRTNLTKEVINEVRSHFKDKVYKTIIPRNIRLSEASGFGKPIPLYDKNSLGAKMYKQHADEVMGVYVEDPNDVVPGEAAALNMDSTADVVAEFAPEAAPEQSATIAAEEHAVADDKEDTI